MSDVSIRDATPDDANGLGIVMTTGFFSAFLGVVPERDLDLEWTPTASARSWSGHFAKQRDTGEFLIVAESTLPAPQIVGLALVDRASGNTEYAARVSILHVLPSWHRHGVGRLLLAEVATRLLAQGNQTLMISCMKDNRHRTFYPALGGREFGRVPGKVDRFQTEEIQYVWDDVTTLLG